MSKRPQACRHELDGGVAGGSCLQNRTDVRTQTNRVRELTCCNTSQIHKPRRTREWACDRRPTLVHKPQRFIHFPKHQTMPSSLDGSVESPHGTEPRFWFQVPLLGPAWNLLGPWHGIAEHGVGDGQSRGQIKNVEKYLSLCQEG